MSKRHLQLDPDNNPLSRKELAKKRDQLEQAPVEVTVTGQVYLFDCDDRSRQRMQRALDHWDALDHTLVNGHIQWTLADNTILDLSQGQLKQVLVDIERAMAIRTDDLQMRYRQLIKGPLKRKNLEDLAG